MAQRVPGHNDSADIGELLLQFGLRIIRMGFHLNNSWTDLHFVGELADLLRREVGQAQGSDFTRFDRPLHCLIGVLNFTDRLMEEEKIDIVQAKTFQGLVNGLVGTAVYRGPEFGGEIEFLARKTGRPDGTADCFFIQIAIGGIDQALPVLQCAEDRLFRIIRLHKKSAHAGCGNPISVVELYVFHSNVSFTVSTL